MSGSVSVHDLPPEILANVFGFLAGPAPSEVLLHEQPSGDMLDISTQHADTGHKTERSDSPWRLLSRELKSISCVSKKWRSIALPYLFRNVLWRPQISSLSVFNLQPIPLLQFLLDSRLNHYVATFTLIVDFTDETDPTLVADRIRPADLEWLWDQLFSVVDPLRFTLIAPPSTLAAFLNRMLFLDDSWSFNIPYHILSLARSSRTTATAEDPTETSNAMASEIPSLHISPSASDQAASAAPTTGTTPESSGSSCRNPTAPPCPLFTLRPWTSILLNEGSSIRAYQTYEYFLRSPPSMLSALLGTGEYPNNQPLLSSTITDLNYIAIFPLSSHVQNLFAHLPKIDRLFIQLTPRPNNMILQNRQAMKQVEMADLWMERNSAYQSLFSELTRHVPQENWASLQVFESGDAADKESWDEALAFLKRTGINTWVPERDGVLVKVDGEGNSERPKSTVLQHMLGGDDEEPLDGTLLSVYPRSSVCAATLPSQIHAMVLQHLRYKLDGIRSPVALQAAIRIEPRIRFLCALS